MMTRALSLAIVVVMTTFVFLNIIFNIYPMVTTTHRTSITSTTKNTATARDILNDTVVMNATSTKNGDESKISPAVETDIASTNNIYNAISDEDGVLDGMNVTITNTSPRENNHTEGAQRTDIAGDTNTTMMDELLSGTNVKDDASFTNGTHKDHNDVQIFQNSQKWLDGPRFGNIHESRMTSDFVKKLIFDAPTPSLLAFNDSEHLLNLSICPSDSNFVNSQPSNEPTRYIASMAMRLMYLAIHEHQHKPARAEAIARGLMMQKSDVNINQTIPSVQNQNVAGPFDFECDPETKYIVASIPSRRGFGSNFRGFGIEPIMLGIMMDRVALYMNSLEFGPTSLRWDFFYSNCPRKDMQCMFMPLSPCVLTHEDILSAVDLPDDDLKRFRTTGYLDDKYKNAKVLVVQTNNLLVHPKGFENSIVEKITSLLNRGLDSTGASDGMKLVHNSTSDHFLLEEVKRYIFNPQNQWEVWQPAALYVMRPNEFLQSELDRILGKIIPQDFDPNSAIGIPIRDGDKCGKESQCMPFDMYIQLAKEMAAKRTLQRRRAQQGEDNITSIAEGGVMYETILVSSDSKSLTDQRSKYVTNASFPFRIIANDEDIGQGHGRPAFFYSNANAVMISTMVALKMHLLPETLVFNSCSNFHQLIVAFYKGCGRAEVGYYESLLQNDNKAFRMWCDW